MTDKIKVIISNKQKTVKIPTGVRMLVRRCCNAVLAMEQFEGSAEISVSFVDDAEIRELNKNNIYGAIVGKAVYSGKLDLKEVLEVSKK